MDVTKFLSKLRSEREDIEQAIRFLERQDQLKTRAPKATAPSLIELRRTKRFEDDSQSGC